MTSSGNIPLEEDEASDFRSFAGGEVKKLLGMPGKADWAPTGCSFPLLFTNSVSSGLWCLQTAEYLVTDKFERGILSTHLFSSPGSSEKL